MGWGITERGCISNWRLTWMILLSNSDMMKTVNMLGMWCFSIKSEEIMKLSFGGWCGGYCSFKRVRNERKQSGLACADEHRKMQNKYLWSVLYFCPNIVSLVWIISLGVSDHHRATSWFCPVVKAQGCILVSWRQPEVPKDSLLSEWLPWTGKNIFKLVRRQRRLEKHLSVADVWFSEITLPSFSSDFHERAVPGLPTWGTCLLEKWNKLLKIPSLPGNLGVFPLWTECLSCLPCAAHQRGQDRFILAPSSTGCHQCEAGTVLSASPSSWWCCLAPPSGTLSSHTCHSNLVTAFPRPVFTFFLPLVLSLWFFS